MTRYSATQLPDWATKVQKVMDAVVSTAASKAVNVPIVPGITRGGSREYGTIPRDLGALAASLQSSLYGGTSLGGSGTGPDAAILTAGGMKAGDKIQFSWGGAVAPYAQLVHDGAKGVAGTHWIDKIANDWPKTVASAVREAKAELG